MRKIIESAIPSQIRLFRINVFELILQDRSQGLNINYRANIYLSRFARFYRKKSILEYLSSTIDQETWMNLYQTYQDQSAAITQNPFTIPVIQHPQAIKDIAKILYECLFDSNYWEKLPNGLSSSFTKKLFKKHYSRTHGYSICPYCDISHDQENASFDIDHLLPISKFPLLSIHEWNLIPICKACNSPTSGKGSETLAEYRNYFQEQLGDNVTFGISQQSANSLSFVASSTCATTFNHLSLIKLNDRMSQETLHETLNTLQRKIFNDLKNDLSNNSHLDFQSAFYFIARDVYAYWRREMPTL